MKHVLLTVFAAFIICQQLFSQQGVAINTDGSAPNSKALLDIKSTDKGMLIPRMTTAQRTAITTVPKGLMVFDNTTNSFWFYDGTAWVELISNSTNLWTASGNNVFNGNSGNVGIGTSTPSRKFEVNGNIYSHNRIDANGVIEGDGVSSTSGLYVGSTSILQGAVTGNSSATFSGNINSNTSISINDPSAILQLKNSGGDKVFVQLSGDNLRMGTNSGNSTGNLVIRMNGTDRVFVDELGRVGVGISNPTSKLHVSGNANVTGDIDLTGNGSVVRQVSGYHNLLPIAYGRVSATGNMASSTSNVSVSRVGIGLYELTCSQLNANSIVTVTLMKGSSGFNGFYTPIVDYVSAGVYRVEVFYHAGGSGAQSIDNPFSFIAYQ